jgi:hypothetical protein
MRLFTDRGNLAIHVNTKVRSRARHLPWHAGRYLEHHGGNATRGPVSNASVYSRAILVVLYTSVRKRVVISICAHAIARFKV